MSFLNYIKPLFTASFWFNLTPPPLLPLFYWCFFIVFAGLIIVGFVSSQVYQKKRDNYILRFSAKYLKPWFITSGILGLILLFFDYERATFFSARFWFLIWFISFGIWLLFIIKKIKQLPERQDLLHKKAEFEKYLPNRKK